MSLACPISSDVFIHAKRSEARRSGHELPGRAASGGAVAPQPPCEPLPGQAQPENHANSKFSLCGEDATRGTVTLVFGANFGAIFGWKKIGLSRLNEIFFPTPFFRTSI